MAQTLRFISILQVVGMLCLPLTCFGESEYLAAYGKAQAEYTQWIADSAKEGKRPTAAERSKKHKLLFADAHKAYVKDIRDMQDKVLGMGRQMMRDLKNYNPPAKELTTVEKQALKDSPFESTVDGKEKENIKALSQSAPTRSVASVAEKAAPPMEDVSAGSAQAVSFGGTRPPASVPTAPVTAPKVDPAEGGGAENVSFGNANKAPAPAAHPPAAPTGPVETSGGTAVNFNSTAPAAPASNK